MQTLTEEALETRLYVRPGAVVPASAARPWPDCAAIHRERRKPGVTLELLHLEYLAAIFLVGAPAALYVSLVGLGLVTRWVWRGFRPS